MTKLINAVLDGKVIVPDEPLGMQPNTPMRIAIFDKSDPGFVDYHPQTQFVRDLLKLREEALNAGMKTKSRDEILRELAEDRGGDSDLS